METIMVKHGKALAVLALALGASAAYGHDSYRAASPMTDPGYGRLSNSMSFQDWINQRQREGTLGNMPVAPYDGDVYVRRSMTVIVPSESTLPPGFKRSDMIGELPGAVIVVPGSVAD